MPCIICSFALNKIYYLQSFGKKDKLNLYFLAILKLRSLTPKDFLISKRLFEKTEEIVALVVRNF